MRSSIGFVCIGVALIVLRPIDAGTGLTLTGYAAVLYGLVGIIVSASRSGIFDAPEPLRPRNLPTYRQGTRK